MCLHCGPSAIARCVVFCFSFFRVQLDYLLSHESKYPSQPSGVRSSKPFRGHASLHVSTLLTGYRCPHHSQRSSNHSGDTARLPLLLAHVPSLSQALSLTMGLELPSRGPSVYVDPSIDVNCKFAGYLRVSAHGELLNLHMCYQMMA